MSYTLADIKPGDWVVYAYGDCGTGFMGYDTDDRKRIWPRPRQVKSVKKTISLEAGYSSRTLIEAQQVLAVFSEHDQAANWIAQAGKDWNERSQEITQIEKELVRLKTERFHTFAKIVARGTNR